MFSHCCKLSKSLCRMAWSSVVLILLTRRQSSANSRVVDETTDDKSFMKSMNKRGPKTVPWETGEETVVAAMIGHQVLHIVCVQAESWLSNHGDGLWPQCCSFIRSLLCGTLSKVLEKSRRIQSICSPTSRLIARSWMESISWVSVDRHFLKPYWGIG